jgi:hypothetical protein
MTVKVVLTGRGEESLARQPGRVMLAHADHTFADLADCLDPAFGRWDLSPGHRFVVDDTALSSGEDVDEDDEDSEELTLGEMGLRAGTVFDYEFDPDEGWRHICEITDVDVDPLELVDDEPDDPVCVDGWGSLPDQYGRQEEADELTEEEDEDELTEEEDEDEDEDETERAASWEVVAHALSERPLEPEEEALARAVDALRRHPDAWPHRLLWGMAEVTPATAPDDAVACWLTLARAMLEPAELDEPGDTEEAAALAALEPADWAGAVIELVRAGVGASADPRTLRDRVLTCPEIEGDEPSEEDAEVVEGGLAVAVPLWQALSAVDAERRLTRLGAWGLPEALRLTWAIADDRELAGQ